jgi:hypothetical protein
VAQQAVEQIDRKHGAIPDDRPRGTT